jgi:hypothetical protein
MKKALYAGANNAFDTVYEKLPSILLLLQAITKD